MNDMSPVIIPKSDQVTADDLLAGPRTITITEVIIRSVPDQPVSIRFEGDGGKPWKPCKSMSKVLVHLWGRDAKVYVGRSLTLFRDEKVTWGGLQVGGIRISHASNIERDVTLALMVTKGKHAAYPVKALRQQQTPATQERPAANNGRTDGATDPTPPTLAERANKVEAALKAAPTQADRDKAWRLASKVREDLDRSDPDRLVELQVLHEELSANDFPGDRP